jgi:hypothetical protein
VDKKTIKSRGTGTCKLLKIKTLAASAVRLRNFRRMRIAG